MNIADIAITSLEVITCFDVVTGDWMFTLDELQNASIANTEEKQDIVGKQGRKLTSLKRNKAATVSGSNGLVSCGLFEMQTGSKFEQKVTDVVWYDTLTVKSRAAATVYKAIGEEGAEIIDLFIKGADGVLNTRLEQADAVAEGKYTYDPDTKALAFHTDVAENTEVVVYYKRNISASVLENKSDVYSGKADMYIDAIGEDKCANVYRIQIHFPKADFSGEFSFDLGDSQTIHNFEAEALAGSCGGSGALWEYTIFGANTEDAA